MIAKDEYRKMNTVLVIKRKIILSIPLNILAHNYFLLLEQCKVSKTYIIKK